MKFFYLFVLFLFIKENSFSQDTIRVLQYNLLYYGTFPSFCPQSSNDPDLKDDYLKTITAFVKPDVFCVNELGAGNANADRILDKVLNSGGVTKFKRGISTSASGSSIVNMLYYNSDKLTLHSQEIVSKDLSNNNLARVIDLYKLFYNSADLAQTKDTVFLTFIVAHLKAGSSTADQDERELETEALMDLLDQKGIEANYIFSGDFNIRSSIELSYQNVVNHSNSLIRFNDPIGLPVNWYDNSAFSDIHTQSTRTSVNTNGGCFASGGADDRFDFILLSNSIIDNLKKVNYIEESYKTSGQDGNRFKNSLNDPTNTSAPPDVINALFEMSDHYPVQLDLLVQTSPSSIKNKKSQAEIVFKNPVLDQLNVSLKCETCFTPFYEILSIEGKAICSGIFSGNDKMVADIDVSYFHPGFYILRVKDDVGNSFSRKIVKQ